MTLLDALFGDDEVASLLDDRACIAAMLEVEAALADAEAELGIIPVSAAASIRSIAADASRIDLAAIRAEAASAGNAAIPFVRQLTRLVAESDADAARWVHWGATSQDILDTALVLQLRRAVPIIVRSLERAERACAMHARRHATTPMAGRTWLQQATPTTFGLKAAGWLDALMRASDRLAGALDQASVLQFGGASGTLASLGANGTAVADALAARLQLTAADAPWHAHRDRLAELASALGIATATLGKIGRDIALLSQTEVGEAAEGASGGSSTMPHKRNPVASSVAIAASLRAPGLVATMLVAMPQEHERGLGGWQAEWETMPELVRLTAGATRAMGDALEGLVVHEARMRANLDADGGLAMAEAVSMALAERVGKSEAHRLVEAASRRAIESGRPLGDVLAEDASVTAHLSPAAIAERLDPTRYLGSASTFIARVLDRYDDTTNSFG